MRNISFSHIIRLLLLFLVIFNSYSFGQVQIKKGLKLGPELLTSLSENTGTFSKSFGFNIAAFTAIKLYSFSESALLLRTEINYTRMQYHNPQAIYSGSNLTTKYDEKFWFGIIQLGIIPEYQFKLNEFFLVEAFFGPSIGIGKLNFNTNHLDDVAIYTNPYDEITLGFVLPTNLEMGFSIYYNYFVFDVRYRYSYIYNYDSKNDFNNGYVQIGFAL